jgi:hypothetical protein
VVVADEISARCQVLVVMSEDYLAPT